MLGMKEEGRSTSWADVMSAEGDDPVGIEEAQDEECEDLDTCEYLLGQFPSPGELWVRPGVVFFSNDACEPFVCVGELYCFPPRALFAVPGREESIHHQLMEGAEQDIHELAFQDYVRRAQPRNAGNDSHGGRHHTRLFLDPPLGHDTGANGAGRAQDVPPGDCVHSKHCGVSRPYLSNKRP